MGCGLRATGSRGFGLQPEAPVARSLEPEA
jgi:hypothetical protein